MGRSCRDHAHDRNRQVYCFALAFGSSVMRSEFRVTSTYLLLERQLVVRFTRSLILLRTLA